jgi:hypothetical protein
MVLRRRSATDHPKFRRIAKVIRRAQRFLSMGLISSSTALSFPLCGVEDHPSDSTASRSHRLAWRVTPRSIRKRSCVRPSSPGTDWRGSAGTHVSADRRSKYGTKPSADQFAHTCADYFSDGPSFSVPRPSKVSSTSSSYVCRTRQRGFRGRWRLIGRLNFRCMPDKFRPTIFVPAEENPNG